MIIIWRSKHVGVILNVLVCDIWINVLLQASALVGPLYIVISNYFYYTENNWSHDGVVAIRTRLQAWQPRNCGSIPGRCTSFLFAETPESALGTSQPPSQGALEALNPGVNYLHKKLTIHLYLAPRLRMNVAVLPDPLTSSCRVLETCHILPLIRIFTQ
jgi:hypothetical protein